MVPGSSSCSISIIAVYAAKARAADTDGGTVGVLGGALRATGTDGPLCTDCECWPARRAPSSAHGRSNLTCFWLGPLARTQTSTPVHKHYGSGYMTKM